MKYLLILLLLSLSCHAQKLPDDVKVTAYRLILPDNDGYSCVASYVKGKRYGTYVTVDADNKNFIESLLRFRKEYEKKGDLSFPCFRGTVQCDFIPNMIVLAGEKISDTIFADDTMQKLYFANSSNGYFDKDKSFIKLLQGNIKEFYDYDFKRHILGMFSDKRDAIPENLIFNSGKSMPEFLKQFKSNPAPFKLVSSDSVYYDNSIKYIYAYHKDTIVIQGFSARLDLENPKSSWSVHGLKIGDSEEALKKKFPLSTKFSTIIEIRFEDIKRRYAYSVDFEDKNGSVNFVVADGKIESIHVMY
jgi:hypothetical protein